MAALHWSLRWPWSRKGEPKGPKTVNIFLGFFFVINYSLGTGFLGIPYSFYYAGYLAAIPTLLLVVFVAWNAVRWELEVMARAQAIETFDHSQEISESEEDDDRDTGKFISDESVKVDQKSNNHPNFEILLTRKFEISELCEIFFNRWVKYIYLIIVVISGFLACWSYATVAGSAWASNIPLNFGTLHQCGPDAFHHRILPTGDGLDGCRNAYYFCLLLFAVIVIPLSLLELKEQAIIQMCLGVLRIVTVVIIIIYCIVKLIQVGEICLPLGNETLTNTSKILNAAVDPVENVHLRDIVIRFNWKGWLTSVPVFTYACLVHAGIPSLTHPIKQKKYLHWLVALVFGSIAISFLSLGVVTPLWFRASVQETVTLLWSRLSGPGNPAALRVLSYYLIFFPSLDVCSAFPLVLQATTNNIFSPTASRNTREKPKHKYDWLIQLFLRIFVAVISILLAFGVANLVEVLKYGGLVGFGLFIFPALLQFQSIRVSKKIFGAVLATKKETFRMQERSGDESGNEQNSDVAKGRGTQTKHHIEVAPLLPVQDTAAVNESSLYMTPYSSTILSHPIAAIVIGTIMFTLFLIALLSLFFYPEKMTCIVSP